MNVMLNLLNSNIHGMSNRDLENIAKKCVKNFKGVYPSDSFPTLSVCDLKQSAIIFNLSPHNEEGSHFVSVYIKNNEAYYFDSYGKPLENTDIKTFLNKHFHFIYYNSKKIQSETSIFCSLFSLSFLLFMQNPKASYKNFIEMFSDCQQKNDIFVTHFIKNLLCNVNNK